MSVEIWWLGQAGFRLRDPDRAGPSVFIDPFLSPGPSRLVAAPISPADLAAQADVVLCTHGHGDHFDRPTLQAAAAAPGSRFTLILPAPLVSEAVDIGLPQGRIVGAQPGAPWETDGLRVQPVPAAHGVDVADAYNFGERLSGGQVRYLGYVVEIGGVRIYHAGDCIPYPDHSQIVGALKPDIALLPINGRDFYREGERNIVGNMDAREAARLASDLGVELLIPMHWEMFPHNRGYPHQLVEYATLMHPTLTVAVLGRGGKLRFSPA
jgi:L-ascorbate 6-phosphate lactonase